jgi:hypothetical protein
MASPNEGPYRQALRHAEASSPAVIPANTQTTSASNPAQPPHIALLGHPPRSMYSVGDQRIAGSGPRGWGLCLTLRDRASIWCGAHSRLICLPAAKPAAGEPRGILQGRRACYRRSVRARRAGLRGDSAEAGSAGAGQCGMRFALLGPLELRIGGRPVDLGGAKRPRRAGRHLPRTRPPRQQPSGKRWPCGGGTPLADADPGRCELSLPPRQ